MRVSRETRFRSSERVHGVILAWFFFSVAVLCTHHPTWPWPAGDAWDYVAVTETLVRHGSLDLRHTPDLVRSSLDNTVVGPDGGRYNIFPLGQSLVQAPAYALAWRLWRWPHRVETFSDLFVRNLALTITPAVLYALVAVVLYGLLRGPPWAFGRRAATAGVLVYGLSTVAFAFSKTNYSEPVQALLLTLLVRCALAPMRAALLTSTASFSWLVLTKPVWAIALPLYGWLVISQRLVQRSGGWERVAAAVVATTCAGVFFWYNWLRTGNPFDAYGGWQGVGDFSLLHLGPNLWELFFGPGRNLMAYNPVLLLALPGIFLVRHRPYRAMLGALWGGSLLVFGSWTRDQWGDYARFLMPLLPLSIPWVVASMTAAARLRGGRRGLAVAAILGVVGCSTYVQICNASYTRFHFNQFAGLYSAHARRMDLSDIEGRPDIRFSHAMLWGIDLSDPEPLASFSFTPVPHDGAASQRLAMAIVRQRGPRWARTDYLFANGDAWTEVAAFGVLRGLLVFATLIGGLALAVSTVRRP